MAVAQHCDAVAQLKDFAEPVRNEHHGAATGGHPTYGREDRVGLQPGQRRGRLIEDDDARPLAECFGDLDELTLSDAQRGDELVGVHAVETHVIEHAATVTHRLASAVDQRVVEVAQQHVLHDCERRHDTQLLVDERDPQPLGSRSTPHLHRLLVHEDSTPVRVELTGQHLDHGALPGPVVPAERMDLTGAQRIETSITAGTPQAAGKVLDAYQRTIAGLVRRGRLTHALLHWAANSSTLAFVTRSSLTSSLLGGLSSPRNFLVYSADCWAIVPGSSVVVP